MVRCTGVTVATATGLPGGCVIFCACIFVPFFTFFVSPHLVGTALICLPSFSTVLRLSFVDYRLPLWSSIAYLFSLCLCVSLSLSLSLPPMCRWMWESSTSLRWLSPRSSSPSSWWRKSSAMLSSSAGSTATEASSKHTVPGPVVCEPLLKSAFSSN